MNINTFGFLVSLHVVAFISLIVFAFFPTPELGLRLSVSAVGGISIFLLLLSDANFREGYIEGLHEGYEDYENG